MKTLETALMSCQKELKDEKAKLDELKEHFKYNLKLINDRDAELQRYDALFLGNMQPLTAGLLLYIYLMTHDIHLVSEGPRRRLRSSTDRSCAVPRTHNTFGDRSFAVARPRVWNSLPANLRDEDITYTSFRRELKTYWFSCGRGAM